MRFRLLIVGADSDYAIERAYRKYLARHPLISELEFFPAQNLFLDYYQGSLWHKLVYRAGLSGILCSINNQLMKIVSEFKPDIVLFFKGMEIYPSTLKKISEQGIKLVNYNPDNPFIFSGRGSGNKNVTKSIRLFDLYMSYDREVCNRIAENKKQRAGLLPFGFDIDQSVWELCHRSPEVVKVCFIGNPDQRRCLFLNELARSGVKLDVYGRGWESWSLHDNISLMGYVKGVEFWMKLHVYRVQLNLLRIHNLKSHNMRTFEIAGIGGIQVAPDTPDHRSFFQEEKEIFLFNEVTDLVSKISWLLSLDPASASQIRHAARKRCLESGYCYKDRADNMASLLQEII